jgi:hypothetical protein
LNEDLALLLLTNPSEIGTIIGKDHPEIAKILRLAFYCRVSPGRKGMVTDSLVFLIEKSMAKTLHESITNPQTTLTPESNLDNHRLDQIGKEDLDYIFFQQKGKSTKILPTHIARFLLKGIGDRTWITPNILREFYNNVFINNHGQIKSFQDLRLFLSEFINSRTPNMHKISIRNDELSAEELSQMRSLKQKLKKKERIIIID